ncbi:MAG: hypothetical protein R3321_15435, partial [Nitrososphaeraceae archaeon]|nr:hypothetical protein [Nitrososphaeraceae archaeon]
MSLVDDKYSINKISQQFKSIAMRAAYSKSFFKEDIYALRFVILLGILLSLVFIIVDANKYQDPWVSISFRGGMAVLLGIFGYLSFFIKPNKYEYTQYYGIAISLIVVTGFYIHYHFNTDPKFDIFLSNILTVLVFIIATITGLRFKNAFFVISISIFAYFIYIPLFNYSEIAVRQITQLVVVYLFTILSSYVLERQKINLFISRSILKEEKSKVESLGAVKNKLFSIVSHDLRSPIVSLKGLVSLMTQEAISKTEFQSLSKNLENKLE